MNKEINFETLRDLLAETNPHPHSELTLTTNLFTEGHLDSYSIILLVQNLEEKLGIHFNFTDLKEFHFESAAAILSLLEKKYDCKVT